MAKVIVYIWDHDRGSSWGHTSLQVEGSSYISWWPMGGRRYAVDKEKHPYMAAMMGGFIGTTNVYKCQHRTNVSLQEDIADEGRGPEIQVTIADDVLNTNAIEKWWKGYQYEQATYHSIKKNCCTTVIRVLREGGSDKQISIFTFNAPDAFSKYKGWEPTDVVEYLRDMEANLGNKRVIFEKNLSYTTQSTLARSRVAV